MASKQTMGCSSKRPSVAEDRLSSLPDHLLHNIMSFLTVRQAVHTCVLSRRWSRLWCSMPCLDIDQREFGGAMVDRTAWESERARFEEFVDKLLMFHNASALDRFRCHVTRCSFEAFERWVCHGIKFSPAVLEILFPRSYDMFSLLPSGFTSCRLKRLHVSGIILGRSCTQQLHSGFPVLEDLQLDRCHLDSSEITSHTLKNLIVTGCTYVDAVLTITAPALATFHLAYTNRFNCSRGIMVNEMPSLVKASVGLPSLVKASVCSQSLVASCNLLCSLVNVQILELSGSETLVSFLICLFL
jgi:hypothetical protein